MPRTRRQLLELTNSVPTEIWTMVFEQLDAKDLCHARLVCRGFNTAVLALTVIRFPEPSRFSYLFPPRKALSFGWDTFPFLTRFPFLSEVHGPALEDVISHITRYYETGCLYRVHMEELPGLLESAMTFSKKRPALKVFPQIEISSAPMMQTIPLLLARWLSLEQSVSISLGRQLINVLPISTQDLKAGLEAMAGTVCQLAIRDDEHLENTEGPPPFVRSSYVLSDDVLSPILSMTRLTHLDLSLLNSPGGDGPDITGTFFGGLGRVTTLKSLALDMMDNLTDDAMRAICTLPALQDLTIKRCINLTDASLAHINTCTSLKKIVLGGMFGNGRPRMQFTTAGWLVFAPPALQVFEIEEFPFFEPELVALMSGAPPKLEELIVFQRDVDDDDVRSYSAFGGRALAALTASERYGGSLKHLRLPVVKWTPECSVLSVLTLKQMVVDMASGLTDAGLAAIAGNTALEELSIDAVELSGPDSLLVLRSCPNLKYLSMAWCKVGEYEGVTTCDPPPGIKELTAALPTLKKVCFSIRSDVFSNGAMEEWTRDEILEWVPDHAPRVPACVVQHQETMRSMNLFRQMR